MDTRITITEEFDCGKYTGQMYPESIYKDDSLTDMDKLIVATCIGELDEFQAVTDANQIIRDVLSGKARIVLRIACNEYGVFNVISD